jgi:OFA family oxalate/formate antiporter-like MFS transporter
MLRPDTFVRLKPQGAVGEFRAGLPILLTAMLGCGLGMVGLSLYSLPFLAGPMAREFGWEYTQVTLAGSFLSIGLVFAGPIAGRLADRFGTRRIVPLSIIAYGVGLLLISRLKGVPWLLYGAYSALAFAGAGTSFAVYARAVNTWFDRARGLALGLMMSGPGLAAALMPFLLPPVVASFGWRGGYLALALASLCALPLAMAFIRERKSRGEVLDEVKMGLTLREALRTRQFWTIIIGAFLVSGVVVGTQQSLVDILSRRHADELLIKAAASTFGITILLGRVVIGAVLDRVRGSFVGCGLFMLTGMGVSLFHVADGWLITLIAAAGLGISAGAEGDLCAYLATRYFGLKSFSEIFGWIFSAVPLGLASGVAIAGYVVRETGSYHLWLSASAGACLCSAVLFLTLGPYLQAGASQPRSVQQNRTTSAIIEKSRQI